MRIYVHFNTQCINNAPHLCKKPRLKQIFKNILAIAISLFLKVYNGEIIFFRY